MAFPQLQSTTSPESVELPNENPNRTSRTRWKLWSLILGYLTWFALQPLVMHESAERWIATVSMIWFSYSLIAAAMAIGCWMALIPGSVVQRFAWGLWCAVCVWLIWSASISLLSLDENGWTRGHSINAYIAALALENLLLTFAVLSPLRWCFGLRLTFPAEPPFERMEASFRPRQFSLAQALYLLAMVALFLGIAREVAPRDFSALRSFLSRRVVWGHLREWVITALVILPASLAIARSPRWAIAGIVYFVALTVGIIVWHRWGLFVRLPSYFYIMNAVLFEGLFKLEFLLHVAGWLLACRWLGYSLEWSPRSLWLRKKVAL